MPHVDDILPDLLLGTLEAPARLHAEQHLGSCARCRDEAARLSPALGGLAAMVTPLEPPPGVLPQLMARMEGPGRFARFADKVAAFFDLGREKALALLESLSQPGVWLPYKEPGVEFVPVEAGPGRAGVLTAFARLAPETRFHHHGHPTREWTFVLEGGLREDSGLQVWPGEVLEKAPGSEHELIALPGLACIIAFAEELPSDTPAPAHS